LLYLAICTQPDILFPVKKTSQKAKSPTYEQRYNVLKIFRYLKGKPNYRQKFKKNINLDVYVDTNYEGDEETRKLSTGFIIKMGTGPTS
jgi:hypothetical protein